MADKKLLISLLKISPLVVSLLSGLIIINGLQFALYLLVKPYNPKLYKKLFYYTSYWLLSHLLFLGEWWGGLDIICYTDFTNWQYLGHEHAIAIMNHRYDADWMVAFAFTDRLKMLGNCRSFAKKVIKMVPFFGWSLGMAGNVFLERDWEKDKEVIGKQVMELCELPSPMTLMLPAEGTRFTPAKHEVSKRFCREKGLPELRHHLAPRTKGFTHTIAFVRGKIPAVYNMQVFFDQGKEFSIVNLFKGEKYVAHLYVERIPLSQLPEGEEELPMWMHQLFQKKDKMTDSFFRTGDIFKESGVPRVHGIPLQRRYSSLLCVVSWAVLNLIPISYFVINLLLSGSLLYIASIFTLLLTGGIFVLKLVRMSQISSSSSYGSSTTRNKGE